MIVTFLFVSIGGTLMPLTAAKTADVAEIQTAQEVCANCWDDQPTALKVADEYTTGYDRGEYGGWRSSTTTAVGWRTTSCKWTYYGTSDTPNCMGNVHRDHLVAVSESYQSGGHLWSREKKRNFYNDVSNIYVMNATENLSKSNYDPAEWKPSDSRDWCRYAKEWIKIKKKYNLTADVGEVNALKTMLDTC